MTNKPSLYLASQSPRRRELLKQLAIPFTTLSVDVDETLLSDEIAEDYVIRLAKVKALAGWNSKQDFIPVLGSDTAVVVDGKILGKPSSKADAKRMLDLLSGKTHQVITAVALATKAENNSPVELNHVLSVSNVTFNQLSNTEIEQYIETGECDDKAGSYAIQGLAAVFITHLSGSYSGVMGLPVYETNKLLNKAGIRSDFLVVS